MKKLVAIFCLLTWSALAYDITAFEVNPIPTSYTFMQVGVFDKDKNPINEKFFIGPLPIEGQAVEMVFVGMEGNYMKFQLRTKQ